MKIFFSICFRFSTFVLEERRQHLSPATVCAKMSAMDDKDCDHDFAVFDKYCDHEFAVFDKYCDHDAIVFETVDRQLRSRPVLFFKL